MEKINNMTEDEMKQRILRDEEKRIRHSNYMCQHIVCQCGSRIMRSNVHKHKQTAKHNMIMDSMQKLKEQQTMNIKTYSYDQKKELLQMILKI